MKPNFRKWNTFLNVKKTNWGLTNDNYLIDQKYVLKQAKIDNPFTDYQQEIKILKCLQNTSITIPIIDFWIEEKFYFIVTKYIFDHKPIKILKNEELMRIAKLIQKLHQISVDEKAIKKIDLKLNLQIHLRLCKQTFPKIIGNGLKVLERFLLTWKPKTWMLSHNDLVLENLILTAKHDYLIDFEYSGLNTKLYDPACLIAESQLWKQPKLYNQWLEIFAKTEKDRQIIDYLVLYRLMIGYLWAGYYYKKTNNNLYKKLQLRKQTEIIDFWTLKIDYFGKTM